MNEAVGSDTIAEAGGLIPYAEATTPDVVTMNKSDYISVLKCLDRLGRMDQRAGMGINEHEDLCDSFASDFLCGAYGDGYDDEALVMYIEKLEVS